MTPETPDIGLIGNRPNVFDNAEGEDCPLASLYRGRPVFLIASGPSFLDLDSSRLSQPGCLTMALNNAARSFRPNLWVSADPPSNFIQSIWHDATILKFVRDEHADDCLFDNHAWTDSVLTPRECPATLFYRSNLVFDAQRFLEENSVNWGNDDQHAGGRSVLLAALKILYCLGVGNVFLLGVDFSMDASQRYHFKETPNSDAAARNNRAYKVLARRLDMLQPEFLQQHFHVWNCNENSNLTAFPFLPFDEAIHFATADLPRDLSAERTEGLYDRGSEIGGNTSIDAELPVHFTGKQNAGLRRIDRSKRPKVMAAEEVPAASLPESSAGVLLYADSSSDWLLPWWFAHYFSSGNSLPVCVVDGGISEMARERLCEHRRVEILPFEEDLPEAVDGWFRKPFAIRCSPFDRTLYLDLDCEIRDSISDILNWCPHGIVLGKDRHPLGKYRPMFRRDLFFNSGVIGVARDNPIVERWCQDTLELHELLRGDQEILNLAIYDEEAKVVVLPEHYHQLRLDGEHLEARITHWTGDAGKEHIRKQMEATK